MTQEEVQTATRISEDSTLATSTLRATRQGGVMPTTIEEMWRIAVWFAKSELIPKSFNTPEKVFVALQYCYEQGLAPFSSMQWLMVQNGRVAEWGDLPVSRVLSAKDDHGKSICVGGIRDRLDGLDIGMITDDTVAVVWSKRKGCSDLIEHSFSVADAKQAGLWGGENIKEEWKRKLCVWVKYPKAMLIWRAKQIHLRAVYADVLHGAVLAEDVPPVGVPAAQTFDPGKALGPEPDHDDLPVGRQQFGFGEPGRVVDAERDPEPVEAPITDDTKPGEEPIKDDGAETQPKPDDGTELFTPKPEAPSVRSTRARQKPDLDVVRRWTANICDKINEALPGLKPGVAYAIGENWLKTLGPQPNGLTWDDLADPTFQAEVKRLWDSVDWKRFL